MLLLDYIFCDDIRFELNNKLSLMGVYYNDRIVFRHPSEQPLPWPIKINFCALLRFVFNPQDELPDSFIFELFSHEKKLLNIDGKGLVPASERMINLPFCFNNIDIKPEWVGFKIILKKGDKEIFTVDKPMALNIISETIPEI